MNPRTIKQLVYGLLFLAIISSVSFYIYYLNTRPTCFDGVMNGTEQGTDCGGECAKACIVIKPLEISERKLKLPGESYFLDVLLTITNPNRDYGSGNIEIIFGDAVLNSYILPNQTKRILFQSNTEFQGMESKIRNVEWKKISPSFNPADFRFKVSNQLFKGSEFEAVVFNESDFDFDTVDIVVILYDDKNSIVGTNKTTINTLLSRTERYFKVVWPQPINGVFRSEVQATTNVFNNSNFIKRYGTPEEFQFKEDQI
ncbi:MAG: hypothetical protein A3J46_03990 [Candidatus Yanofskybacteria bacterium RIFCSPHIGHO2_02_FULL_41_11]|uniref:Uncharacterized protein n=1 Tax=Candidatus Yanofskybacteria bacterium RIFCSPHIGHO2_02_FULL_41_11 TaxID=1802675 RepID=A0A1F8F6U3_9BACT|nr:MAG: hypothetical protein A3J46_03990 [Candidatus Yanofskybacteria bacterium RIFCSPHIGHO2_02_FULL_41_11]